MSGGFFFEHVVEYFLPKCDAEKQQKKKKSKTSDHPETKVPMKK
ncbi:AAEL008534-PA [Aedes aegypti]|uniref:AAEL008534-PA n=1 Tax=Aedes aegypti TaxID=7159 RepID=Q16YG6_AEDAE|nr:AAEL008534-PA [Aedes aegypti]